MRALVLFGLVAGLAGCATTLPEASCKCFDASNNSTGRCKFETVAGAPPMAYLPTRSAYNPNEVSFSTKGDISC